MFDRSFLRSLTSLVALASMCGLSSAQEGKPRPVKLESAADGLPIAATYYPAKAEQADQKMAPVVLLLQGDNENRLVWEKKPTVFSESQQKTKALADVLHDEGYAVMTIDLRGQGESPLPGGRAVRNADYPAMLGDIEAAKRFLMEEHQAERLNINKLGIVAADSAVPLAVNYAKLDWEKPDYDDAPTAADRTPRGRDVRALVLMSPANSAGRVRTLSGISFTRDPRLKIATLLLYGKDDPQDDGLSMRIAGQLRTDDDPLDEYAVVAYPTRFRGTGLIGDGQLNAERHAVNFLNQFLKGLPSEWVDRRSRLVR